MAKLQGYVRSVSVNPKKISEGSHVYWDGCPSKVKLWYVRQVDPNGYTIISPNIISPRGQTPHIDDLKTLIIEYVTENGDVRVGDIWTSLTTRAAALFRCKTRLLEPGFTHMTHRGISPK